MSRRWTPASVEQKVARALADKEGIALKMRLAIEEEAEKKRLRKEAAERAKPRQYDARSYGCQVRAKDIPGAQCLKLTETESRFTGVHFQDDYDSVRSTINIPFYPDQKPFNRETLSHQVRMKTLGTTASINNEEEKYTGPLLNGTAPEMIVSSGALGMTNTKRKVQVNYQQSRKRIAEEYDNELEDYDDSGPSTSMRPPNRMSKKVLTVRDFLEGGYPLTPEIAPLVHAESSKFTSPDFPTTSVERKSEPLDPMDETIFRVVEKSLKGEQDDYDKFVKFKPKKKVIEYPEFYDDHLEEEPYEEFAPEPKISEKERLEMEKQEKIRLRFKEIGRRICELELSDFAPDKTKNDRKSYMIASRGEEILASVRRNLGIIKEKLGEYSEGTIFEHVDNLTDSFAVSTPNALSRLTELVAEKLKQRAGLLMAEKAAAAAAKKKDLPISANHSEAVKQEEPEIKTEPPEYMY
ncbi:unnamed protein product [Caenorhabditis brenneri]